MTNEIIFYTQLATIIGFIILVFVLYRLLVSQKDATIESLREKNDFLSTRLEEAQNQNPDVLVQTISTRVKVLTEELERLSSDKAKNESLIKAKEFELTKKTNELRKYSSKLERAQEIMSEFFCRYCNAPMLIRDYASECVEHEGRELDIDHEHIVFECGLTITDGEEVKKCGSPF